MSLTIECQKRTENSKPNALRREGLVPVNLYGHKGAESISLMVNTKEATNLLKKAKANTTLIDVKVPELSWEGKAVIREIQAHPWKKTLYHLIFFYIANPESFETKAG
jgi:large subunit ribosomal protein L25